jgi:hypothetical protein
MCGKTCQQPEPLAELRPADQVLAQPHASLKRRQQGVIGVLRPSVCEFLRVQFGVDQHALNRRFIG